MGLGTRRPVSPWDVVSLGRYVRALRLLWTAVAIAFLLHEPLMDGDADASYFARMGVSLLIVWVAGWYAITRGWHRVDDRLRAAHEGEAREKALYQRHDALVNQMLDALVLYEIVYDNEHAVRGYRLAAANQAFERLSGVEVKAAVGKMAHELFPEMYESWSEPMLEVAITGQASRVELQMPDGRYVEAVIYSPMPGQIALLLQDTTTRRNAERQQDRLVAILGASPDTVMICDMEGRLQYVNPAGRRLLCIGDDEQASRFTVSDLVPEEHRDSFSRVTLGEAMGRGSWQGESMLMDLSANAIVTWMVVLAHKSPDGATEFFSLVARDIRRQKESEAKLRQTASLLKATLDSTADGLMVSDGEGRVISYNQRFLDMWGMSQDVIEHRDERLVMGYVIDQLVDPKQFVRRVEELYANANAEGYDIVRLRDGRVFERFTAPQRLERRIVGRVWSFRDVTDQKKAEDQLRYAATHDALTGLPNRTVFAERLAEAIARSRASGERFTVVFVDLDRFKIVNESLGHHHGDQMLVAFSQRVQDLLRQYETSLGIPGKSVLARLGGDEFVVLLEAGGEEGNGLAIAERIEQDMAQPFLIDGHEVHSSVSIGIVHGERTYELPDEVIRDADTALYHAKSGGKARHVVFDRQMHDLAMQRLRLESDLRKAIDRNEFFLTYQPIVDMATGQLEGFEALVRWRHPERGMVSPVEFIPLAEETGLIVPLGEFVLAESCRQLRVFRQRYGLSTPVCMSVNLSKRQMIEENLVERVTQIIRQTQIDPRWLKLEITESVVMEHAESVTPVLNELKQLGVRLAMDDFGTGHSSLACLQKFPIDYLKLDRSFIMSLGSDRQYSAVVNAVVTLAHNLGILVIAEGIETVEQLVQLQCLDCDFGQGYYFSKPATIEVVHEFFKNRSWLRKSA